MLESTEGEEQEKVVLPNDYYTPDYPVGFQLEYITPELHDKEVKELTKILKPYNLSDDVKVDLTIY